MSAATPQTNHFQQRELKGSKIKDILSQLGKWLEGAVFEDDGTLEKCADPGLDEACKSLLIELGVYEKVVRTVRETLRKTEYLADSSQTAHYVQCTAHSKIKHRAISKPNPFSRFRSNKSY